MHRILEESWQSALRRNGKEEFLYLSGIRTLLDEIEFQVKSTIFSAGERQQIQNLARQHPLLKLQHHEVEKFVLRLCHAGSFDKLLARAPARLPKTETYPKREEKRETSEFLEQLRQLERAIEAQAELIERLEAKLKVQPKVPVLHPYLPTNGLLAALGVIFGSFVVVGVLQFAYYVMLAFLSPQTAPFQYIYPVEQDPKVGFSIVQELPWLEYMVYRFSEALW